MTKFRFRDGQVLEIDNIGLSEILCALNARLALERLTETKRIVIKTLIKNIEKRINSC